MSDTTWTPVTVRLADLTPWERNPKRISKTHARNLLELWQEIGQFQTVAIGPSGEVYDGHQRLSVLKAAYGAGYEVDARQSSRPLTEQEREKLVIAAHTGTVGSWDWDALSGWDAGDLQQWGFDGELLAGWQTDIGALRTMLDVEIELPNPQLRQEPQLDTECFVEVYCSREDLAYFQTTLDAWAERIGVTINIS